MIKFIAVLITLIINTNFVAAKSFKKTIMIDLDGVLDNYTVYTDEIPSIKEGAKEFVIELSKDFNLVLFTTRDTKQAVEWLQINEIDKYFSDVTKVKNPAYIYIDDIALKFNGNYDETLKEIEKFDVYWKDK